MPDHPYTYNLRTHRFLVVVSRIFENEFLYPFVALAYLSVWIGPSVAALGNAIICDLSMLQRAGLITFSAVWICLGMGFCLWITRASVTASHEQKWYPR